jgi:hypothetical protein
VVHVWTGAVLGVLYGVPAYLGACLVRKTLTGLTWRRTASPPYLPVYGSVKDLS